jgi:hypothetical protein
LDNAAKEIKEKTEFYDMCKDSLKPVIGALQKETPQMQFF